MYVALREVMGYGAWLCGVHRTHRDSSSYKCHQPCQKQTALQLHHLCRYSKCATKNKKRQSLIESRMQQECSESAWERIALYKSNQQQQQCISLSLAPVPNKPTVSVDVKQHFNQATMIYLLLSEPSQVACCQCAQRSVKGDCSNSHRCWCSQCCMTVTSMQSLCSCSALTHTEGSTLKQTKCQSHKWTEYPYHRETYWTELYLIIHVFTHRGMY